MRASAIINGLINKLGMVIYQVKLVVISVFIVTLSLLWSSVESKDSVLNDLLMLKPRRYWREIGRILVIIIPTGIILIPNSPEILRKMSAAVLLVGIVIMMIINHKDQHCLLVAEEAKTLSHSMSFLRAIENIERDGTTRELLIQKYRHEERREELSGADIVNSSKYLNMLELDDSLFCYPNIIYRQSVVATAMMIVGINRVVVRDLEGSVLYTSKGVTLIPLNKKFKILIELAKKLNYEVRIEG